jgi:hypothetical protein
VRGSSAFVLFGLVYIVAGIVVGLAILGSVNSLESGEVVTVMGKTAYVIDAGAMDGLRQTMLFILLGLPLTGFVMILSAVAIKRW